MPEAPGGPAQVYRQENKADSPDPDSSGLPRGNVPATDDDDNIPDRTRSAFARAAEIDLESDDSSLMAQYSASLTAHTTGTTDGWEGGADGTWRDERVQQINHALLGLSLGYAIRFSGCSTRLANAATRAGFDQITLSDYLAEPAVLVRKLFQMNGVGRKTIDEAIVRVEKFVGAAVKVSNARGTVESTSVRSDAVESAIDDSAASSVQAAETARSAADLRPPRQRLADAVARLPDKEQFVIEGRYGLNGQAERTLQELAAQAQVTRERIRQIEVKALRHLRLPMHRVVLDEFLRAEKDVIWRSIAGGNDLVSPQEFRDARSRLDPWQLLAIELVHDNLSEWLAQHASIIGKGWLRNGASLELLRKATQDLEAFAQGHALPMPVATASALLEHDCSTIDVAAEKSSLVKLFEGYLCEVPVGARTRRAVRLHAAAIGMSLTAPVDIATLAGNLREQHPDDGCGPRVIQMQLEDATNLFRRMYDNLWFALPVAQGTGRIGQMPFERDMVLQPAFEAGSIGADLVELMKVAPRRHVDLRDAMLGLHGDRIAASSVGAVLVANPCFRRVAPGIFDLCRPGSVYDEHGVLNELFLDERQCRAFCQARYGGAPVDWYPAWGPSLELWLTRWARVNAEPDLFRSLILVGDPSTWPAPPDELDYWRRIKEREGAWLMGAERRFRLGRSFIEPGQFVSTLAHLVFFGWTSWVAVNRTTDARGDVHDAADILAILVKTGLAQPVNDWQAKHIATPMAAVMLHRACNEMHINGALDWESGVLAQIWTMLAAAADGERTGWIEPDEYAEALVLWRNGEARSSRSFSRKAADVADPAPIFETDDWGRLFNAE